MKNEEIKKIDPMKKLISEAGIDTPGEGFHFSVLKKIEALPKTAIVYRPVISAFGWKLILGFISSIFAWSVFSLPKKSEPNSLFDKLTDLKLPVIDFKLFDLILPTPHLSSNLLLGIGAFFIMGSILIINILRQKQAQL